MSKITIYDNGCQITEESDFNFIKKLDQNLSYQVQGAQFSPSFKRGRWDGFFRILTNKLSFPYGLLTRVKELYTRANKTVEVIDKREPKMKGSPIDILTPLKELGKTPYPYQMSVLDAVDNNDCGIIRIATGGGKLLVSALITAHLGKPTNIYVIGTDLIYQGHKFFSSIFNEKIGIIGDGQCDIQRINIVSVWSVGTSLGLERSQILTDENDEKDLEQDKYQEIRNLLKSTKVHILDECHLASCQTIQSISKNIMPDHIYGMSASPWRDDGTDLLIEASLGRNIVEISASKLINEGYLVKPVIKFVKVPPPEEKIPKSYQTVYKKYITNNPVRNNMVVNAAVRLVEQGFPTLVLYTTIPHGELLYNELSQKMPCALLSGKDSSEVREDIKSKMESGEIKCIVASKIYDIGVDIPNLAGLVLAGGGKSSVRALQRIGRVIRLFKGKTMAAVVDFYDQTHYLKEHSKARYDIYKMEPSFEVYWIKS